MQAVIYCRVSTKEQVENLSLATQRKACEEYCKRESWDVARVFVEEGESAKTADRTELTRMIAYCRENKRKVGVVVVYNVSRFSRNTGNYHTLRGLLGTFGIKLKSATEPLDDSATGRFMETIFSAVAQLDNDVKADRTRAGMRAALELGRWTWRPPFGYARGPRGGPSMVPHPEHAVALRTAFADFAGGMGTPEVLRRLKACGFEAPGGGVHTHKSLGRMLRNPLYAGRVEMPEWGVSRLGDFEPLVREVTFDSVQARFNDQSGRKVPHAKDHPDFPLRRFVRCGRCKAQGLTASWVRGRSGRYGYYHCIHCGLRAAKAVLESAFVGLLDELQPRREYVRLFSAVVLDVWRKREASARADRERDEAQVAALRAKLDRLAELLADGVLDAADYQRQRDRLRERIAVAETSREVATEEHLDVDAVLSFAEHVLTNAARLWEHASPEHKVRLQRVLFPEGLAWEASGKFETAPTSSAFTELRAIAGCRARLASPTGFEPVSPP